MSDVAPESQRRPPWASGRRVRRGIGSGIGRDSSMGWYKTRRAYPWWVLIALGMSFPFLVGIFYWLYFAGKETASCET